MQRSQDRLTLRRGLTSVPTQSTGGSGSIGDLLVVLGLYLQPCPL